MDLAAHNIAYYLFLQKNQMNQAFRMFHFASEGEYTQMMYHHLEYLFLSDELKLAAKGMSLDQHMVLNKLIIQGIL